LVERFATFAIRITWIHIQAVHNNNNNNNSINMY